MSLPHFVWMWHGTELQHLAIYLEIVATLTYVVWSTWNLKGAMRVWGLPQQCNNCNLKQQPSLLARGTAQKDVLLACVLSEAEDALKETLSAVSCSDDYYSVLAFLRPLTCSKTQDWNILYSAGIRSGGVAQFLHNALLLMPLRHRIRHFALLLIVGLWGSYERTGLSWAWTRPTLLAVLIWVGLQRGC